MMSMDAILSMLKRGENMVKMGQQCPWNEFVARLLLEEFEKKNHAWTPNLGSFEQSNDENGIMWTWQVYDVNHMKVHLKQTFSHVLWWPLAKYVKGTQFNCVEWQLHMTIPKTITCDWLDGVVFTSWQGRVGMGKEKKLEI